MPRSVPFATSAGTASPALDALVAGPAAALTAVAVVAGPRAGASGWGAAAAVALARRWAGDRRVLLADLDLARPRLHELLGVRNDEGVVDIIEFGVSPGRVMLPVDENRFDLLPAGPFATDPAAVLRHPAWARLLVELAARRATLLAYVPSDAAGADAVIDRAGAVLLLAEGGEGDDVVASLARPYAVLAVLTPAGAAAADTTAADAVPRLTDAEFTKIRLPTERGARDALILELRERQRDARLTPPPVQRADRRDAQPRDSGEERRAPLAVPAGTGEAALEMRLESAADDVSLDLDVFDPALAGGPPRRPPRRS
ncbi:MAG: hypothetical protein WD054_03605, partial [Gemmatimonadota bacterium]